MATTKKTEVNKSQYSTETRDLFVRYVLTRRQVAASNSFNMRERMQQIDREYQREVDYTKATQRAEAAARAGDNTKMQNVTIPVVMPQVESMLTYLCEIFLSSYPLFPVVSKPQMVDEGIQMETTIGEQGMQFCWVPEIMQGMREALKYNLGALEVDWESIKSFTVTSDATTDINRGQLTPVNQDGNFIRRRDPYNLILDKRVPPYENHTRGEFAGYTEIISKIEMKQRVSNLDPMMTMNIREAFESGKAVATTVAGGIEHFVPFVNKDALVTPTELSGQTDWDSYAGIGIAGKIQYASQYEWCVMYCRILPSEFKIITPAANTPQIYKIITINQKVLIYVEKMTNAHNYLPLLTFSASEDGLGWQTKSFADNSAPFQRLATGLFNSGLESQRRKVYDRMIYDPSMIDKAAIDNTSPVARIPIKQSAYGKKLSEAVYPIPYRDDNVNEIFNVSQMVLEMADVAVGQNRVQRGQFQKGNKTRKEFDDTMNNSDSRPRMVALLFEYRLFQPLKHILKFNTLQFLVAGDVYNRNLKRAVNIDPVQLRKTAMEFKLADGLLPSSSIVNMESFDKLMNVAAQNPAIAMQYDLVGMYVYSLKLQGATWVDDFKVQPAAAGQAPAALPPPTTPPQP